MISIIIPVYNVAPYLDECLQSVVNQEYTDWECILVDDGSTDGSSEICDVWGKKDSRFVVCHQENGGVSKARNYGIRKAKGEYIVFIDSDDLVAPTYLSDMVNALKLNEHSELYVSGFILYPVKPQYNPSIPIEQCTFILDNAHIKQFVQLNERYLIYGPCSKLYRTSIIREKKIRFNTQRSLGEDLCFNYDYLRYVTQITTIPKANYFYREVGEDSLSNKYRDDLFDLSYEQWHIIKDFYVVRDMWSDISKRYLYHLLWSFVYDGIFVSKKRKGNIYHYIKKVLSIKELSDLREYSNEYHCAKWIKYAILHRCTWIFYLYFIVTK